MAHRLLQLSKQFSTMAPIKHFEYLVIGGGSGGVASARRAAKHGAKTLLIEGQHLGGTCVNVGCVPKKVMWYASDMAAHIKNAKYYDFDVPSDVKFDWTAFKHKRDAYIERLRKIYASNLTKEGVEFVFGWASFIDENTVKVMLNDGGEATYTADTILVAAGGAPTIPDLPGADLGITSDGFFELETQPKKVAIVGAGYIAAELAGVFNELGTETHMILRHGYFLRNFDPVIGTTLTDIYEKEGVHVHKNSSVKSLEKTGNTISVNFEEGGDATTLTDVDTVLWSVGRHPLSYHLNLKKIGVKLDKKGKVEVDEWQATSVPNIFSIGDMAEDVELTPVAIAAGRRLSDRLFGGKPQSKLDYTNIPSTIFTHPEAASIGLSEDAAREKYKKVKVYQSKFINMSYSPFPQDEKLPCVYKIVCEGENERVVGLHIVGDASGEIMQGFGVAIKMGATKADFDNCVAIHPTAAEEIVTMT